MAEQCLLNQLAFSNRKMPNAACTLCSKTERDLEKELRYAGRMFSAPANEQPEDQAFVVGACDHDTIAGLRRFDRPFRKSRVIAKGAIGQVFADRDERLPNQEFAVKELLPKHAHSRNCRTKILHEARMTAMLDHSGIVSVFGYGAEPDILPFFAMQLINGQSLRYAIKEFHQKSQHLDETETSRVLCGLLNHFVRVCEAAAYAHDHNVIHRDINPNNIMLRDDGATFLIDWGIAMFVEDDQGPPLLSLNDKPVGTRAFMSPEQAMSDSSSLTHHCDVFSLGATLFMILAGKPPYDQRSDNFMENVRAGDFQFPASVAPMHIPAALKTICLRAMTHSRSERYQCARKLGQDVAAWVANESPARPDS